MAVTNYLNTVTVSVMMSFMVPLPSNRDPSVSQEEKDNAMSAIAQRRLVGFLGILLPLACAAYTVVAAQAWLPTISHYYYTPVHGAFIVIISGLGMVLFVFRGYDKWDRTATTIAAIAALGVALFPAERPLPKVLPDLAPLFIHEEKFNGGLHNVSAVSLFLMFFFISGFLFTRRPPTPGTAPSIPEVIETAKKTLLFTRTPNDAVRDERELENKVHRRCAWIILISIILFALFGNAPAPVPAIFETTAIFGFACSWLWKNRAQVEKGAPPLDRPSLRVDADAKDPAEAVSKL
jgi:hypothetical protein